MAGVTVRACLRCHRKKVKCTGFPGCQNCDEASVQCQQYIRSRKADTIQTLRDAERRIRWLERELSREVGADCSRLPTGASIQKSTQHIESASQDLRPSTSTDPLALGDSSLVSPIVSPTESHRMGGVELNFPAKSEAPDISLLALNATGEQKYLGPSSGAFFASYATALLRSCAPSQAPTHQSGHINEPQAVPIDDQQPLQREVIRLLIRSYELWIQPLYPLLKSETLEGLASRCYPVQNAPTSMFLQRPEQCSEMTVFYLVMALGATNYVSTCKQLPVRLDPTSVPSSVTLYSMALRHFEILATQLHPSVTFIQILLLVCIYSSYGPIQSSQWQMAGLAMRTATEIGLHYRSKDPSASEEEDWRNRIFWTAYSIEISLCYNLGRPPSISEEHITARLPHYSTETAFGIQYIKHRQIQNRIVSRVYSGTSSTQSMSLEKQQELISDLQSELDEWRSSMINLCSEVERPCYPFSYWDRLYHGTSFVLHRKSPLCQNPSTASLERCIRSCGAYIDSMLEVLRASNVPLSWMLVQGVLFAGLTMLITARTGSPKLSSNNSRTLLLIDFPAWTRKCSVCLAIMNERWNDDLLSKLDAQFEILADGILRGISTELAFHSPDVHSEKLGETGDENGASLTMPQGPLDPRNLQPSTLPDPTLADSWENMDYFGELMGIQWSQSFWDICPQGTEATENSQDEFQTPSRSHIVGSAGLGDGTFIGW